jgi:two-component system, NtrC family, sensor histidine kinase HydH
VRPTGVPQAIGIVLATFAIAVLHSVTPLRYQHWHDAFQHLYFFPVVYAALRFGWRGGVAAAVLATLVQVVHIRETWTPLHTYAVGQILEIPLLFAAGLLCGLLVERERRQRQELARTTQQLNEVYLQLQQNFDQMKRAERLYAVGQLAAGLAHEIRNPLASISGASGILQRTARLEDQQARVLAVIDKECQRLTRLLSEFLDFARPRAPKFQAVDVTATVVQPVIELAAHAIRNKNLSLRRVTEPDLPIVECDPDQLRQLLLNLIINAIQATGEGEVLVSALRQDDKVLLRVKDQGCGIPEENREKVFDPFFTTKEGGTGLGLSVAHQIVEQHGGVLTAETNAGGGMTFTAQLPLRHKAFS